MSQSFLVCVNGDWHASGSTPQCSGSLQSYTAKEVASLIEQEKESLTTDEANQLLSATVLLFALVFGILIIKKAINR